MVYFQYLIDNNRWGDGPRDSNIDKTTKLSRAKDDDLSPENVSALYNWVDFGIDEDSAAWMRVGVNRSLTGVTEQYLTGEARYNIDDYEQTFGREVGATLLSFLMPLDMIAMAAGGWVGSGRFAVPYVSMLAPGAAFGGKATGTWKGLSGLARSGMADKAIKIANQRKLNIPS